MIKIGLVGAGGMGAVHLENYRHIGGARVAAVVGASERDAAKASEWGLPFYRGVQEMLGAEEIDIVDVCTPTHLHPDAIRAGVAGGRHVITEKPMALESGVAKALFDAADAAGVQIYVAHVLQFYRQSEILRGIMASGEYGRPLDAYFFRLSACPRWAEGGWLFDRSKSGLVPFDLHIHDLDLIVSIFGRPLDFKMTRCVGRDRGYSEHCRFSYRYEGMGVAAEAGWLNADIPFTAGWRVCFEGAVVANDGGAVTAYGPGAPPKAFDTEEATLVRTGINVPPTGTYLAELGHFVDCARKGVPSDRVTRGQVLTVLDLLEAMTALQP
jgi:predicted dehydrogenase